jgi:hypothetical protein
LRLAVKSPETNVTRLQEMNEQKLKELLEKGSVTPEERIEIAKQATNLAIDRLLDCLVLNKVPPHVGISAMMTILGRHFRKQGASKACIDNFFEAIKLLGVELQATTEFHMGEK